MDFNSTNAEPLFLTDTVRPMQPPEQPADTEICPICRHPFARSVLTKHHLVPKSRRGRETVLICRDCHRQIHAIFSEKELERSYGTLDTLLAAPDLQSWIGWSRKRKPGKRIAVKTSRRRRGRK